MLRGSTVTAHCSARGMIRIRYSVSLLLVTDREHSFIVVWDEHPLAIHSGLRIVKVEMKPDRYIALYGVHIDFVVLGVFWSSDSIISAILAPATPMQYGARSRIWSMYVSCCLLTNDGIGPCSNAIVHQLACPHRVQMPNRLLHDVTD